MEASVGRALVKADASDAAAAVRLNETPVSIAHCIRYHRRRHNRGRPDGLLGCRVPAQAKTTAKPNSTAPAYLRNFVLEFLPRRLPGSVEMTFCYDHAMSPQ